MFVADSEPLVKEFFRQTLNQNQRFPGLVSVLSSCKMVFSPFHTLNKSIQSFSKSVIHRSLVFFKDPGRVYIYRRSVNLPR